MREPPVVFVVVAPALGRVAELLLDDFGCEQPHSAQPLQTGGGPTVLMGLRHFAVEPPGQFELTPPPPLPAASALTVKAAVTTAAKAILESKVERAIAITLSAANAGSSSERRCIRMYRYRRRFPNGSGASASALAYGLRRRPGRLWPGSWSA